MAVDAGHHLGRFPRGGALLLALVGASGSVSTAVAGPVMGWIADTYGAASVLPVWALLPAVLSAISVLIYLADRAKGGYRIARLDD